MIPGPFIAEIAGLVGEPARATMLSALLDGRALTASELAHAARVTPQTASTHLKADRGRLGAGGPRGTASVFSARIAESRRDDRGHRRRCARKQTAIPPCVA